MRVDDEKEKSDPFAGKPVYSLPMPEEDSSINIYDYGHFEGLKFCLNEPIQAPGGKGEVRFIEFSGMLHDLGDDNMGMLEAAIQTFLTPELLSQSELVTPKENQQIKSMRYN